MKIHEYSFYVNIIVRVLNYLYNLFIINQLSFSSNLYLTKLFLLPIVISLITSSITVKSMPLILNILFPLQYIITVSGNEVTPTCFSNYDCAPAFDTKKLIGFFEYLAANWLIWSYIVLGFSTNAIMQVDFESLHRVL